MGSGKGKNKRVRGITTPSSRSHNIQTREWSGDLPQTGIYLDDKHSPMHGYEWQWVRNVDACIAALAASPDTEFLSLDYDLGLMDAPGRSGEDVLNWIIANDRWPQQLLLHTGSYEDRDRMHARIVKHSPYTVVEDTPIGPMFLRS